MSYNYLLLDIFGMLACFLYGIVAREAIVNGYIVNKSEQFRYQVAIWVADQSTNCGGGIIDEHSILTSASCVIGKNNELIGKPMYILAGTIDLSIQGVVIEVHKIYVPMAYNPHASIIENNVAVLKLNKCLGLENNHNLTKLKLPTDRRRNYTSKSATIAGYGWDWIAEYNHKIIGGPSGYQLRFAETEVLSHIHCLQDHSTLPITDRNLCARIKQRDHSTLIAACHGDGGGPLVFKKSTVIGVLSVTEISSTKEVKSGVYTAVSQFLTFINNAMKNIESRYIRIIKV